MNFLGSPFETLPLFSSSSKSLPNFETTSLLLIGHVVSVGILLFALLHCNPHQVFVHVVIVSLNCPWMNDHVLHTLDRRLYVLRHFVLMNHLYHVLLLYF